MVQCRCSKTFWSFLERRRNRRPSRRCAWRNGSHGYPTNMRKPVYQRGPRGSKMSSAEARRMSASVGSLVATLPAVLADLSGSLGEKIRRSLPGPELVTSIWEGVRGLRVDGGVTEEDMCEVVPRGWRDRAFRPQEVSASGHSDREVLAAHDAETTNSHKYPQKTRKTGQPSAVRPVRHITRRTSHPCAPAGGGRPFRGERNP